MGRSSVRHCARNKSKCKLGGELDLDGFPLDVNDGRPGAKGDVYELGDDHVFELHLFLSKAPLFANSDIKLK